MKFFRRFAPEKALKVKCNHDWEEVSYWTWGDIIKEVVSSDDVFDRRNYEYMSFKYKGHEFWGRRPEFVCTERPKQKVCLKCGECHNGVADAIAKFQKWIDCWAKGEQDAIDRKELAKKMWKQAEIERSMKNANRKT